MAQTFAGLAVVDLVIHHHKSWAVSAARTPPFGGGQCQWPKIWATLVHGDQWPAEPPPAATAAGGLMAGVDCGRTVEESGQGIDQAKSGWGQKEEDLRGSCACQDPAASSQPGFSQETPQT